MMFSRSSEMDKIFTELDKDESGDLDSEELIETLQDICMLEEFMVRSLINDFDKNGDGKVSRKEFNDLWSKLAA